jgi:hypothetical protein
MARTPQFDVPEDDPVWTGGPRNVPPTLRKVVASPAEPQPPTPRIPPFAPATGWTSQDNGFVARMYADRQNKYNPAVHGEPQGTPPGNIVTLPSSGTVPHMSVVHSGGTVPPDLTLPSSGHVASSAYDTATFDNGTFDGPPNTNTLQPGEERWINDAGQPVTFVDDKGDGAQSRAEAALHGEGALAANAQIIEQQLSYRLDEARRAARAFSQAFKDQAEELKKKNDRTPQFDDFVAFLEKMASGLSELADALDRAFEAAGGSPEPIFLGKAGEIIRRLQLTAMEWLEKEKDTVIDISFRLSLFCSGMIFLHSFGIYDTASTGVLGGLVLKGGSKKSSDNKPQ